NSKDWKEEKNKISESYESTPPPPPRAEGEREEQGEAQQQALKMLPALLWMKGERILFLGAC
ncbi:MAG: hypothetical protein WCA07_08560, partial [Gloeobacterales cyanobacterium]